MDEAIFIDSDSKDSSILELEVPKRKTPPLIEVEDDIILNVEGKLFTVEGAEDIIKTDLLLNNIEENRSSKENCQNNQHNNKSNNHNDKNPSTNSLKTSESISPNHWTSDMIKFYNDDCGHEKNFSVEKIQRKMDKNPVLWEISRKDFFFMHNRLKKSHIKCSNCGHHGHGFLYCPEPPYVPKCHMCGTPGHSNNSCPNSICLNCGCKTHEYTTFCPTCEHEAERVCSRCLMKGHHFINCTDNWRLFHLTTNQKKVRVPKKYIYKNEKDVWCCNCGRKGHYQTSCSYRKDFASFMDTYPFVASYENSYNNDQYSKSLFREPHYIKPHRKNKSKTKKKNIKAKVLLQFNPLNNVLKKEPVKKKKKKKKKTKIKQENDFIIKKTEVFLPLGL